MIKQLQEDFSILGSYVKKHVMYYFNRLTYGTRKKIHSRKLKKQTLMETLMQLDGARQLGGEFMGKRYIERFPVLFYRLKRNTADGSMSFYYVAYILRGSTQYQVVVHENWEAFLKDINKAIETNQKAIIGIRQREGGRHYGSAKSRNGRKIL